MQEQAEQHHHHQLRALSTDSVNSTVTEQIARRVADCRTAHSVLLTEHVQLTQENDDAWSLNAALEAETAQLRHEAAAFADRLAAAAAAAAAAEDDAARLRAEAHTLREANARLSHEYSEAILQRNADARRRAAEEEAAAAAAAAPPPPPPLPVFDPSAAERLAEVEQALQDSETVKTTLVCSLGQHKARIDELAAERDAAVFSAQRCAALEEEAALLRQLVSARDGEVACWEGKVGRAAEAAQAEVCGLEESNTRLVGEAEDLRRRLAEMTVAHDAKGREAERLRRAVEGVAGNQRLLGKTGGGGGEAGGDAAATGAAAVMALQAETAALGAAVSKRDAQIARLEAEARNLQRAAAATTFADGGPAAAGESAAAAELARVLEERGALEGRLLAVQEGRREEAAVLERQMSSLRTELARLQAEVRGSAPPPPPEECLAEAQAAREAAEAASVRAAAWVAEERGLRAAAEERCQRAEAAAAVAAAPPAAAAAAAERMLEALRGRCEALEERVAEDDEGRRRALAALEARLEAQAAASAAELAAAAAEAAALRAGAEAREERGRRSAAEELRAALEQAEARGQQVLQAALEEAAAAAAEARERQLLQAEEAAAAAEALRRRTEAAEQEASSLRSEVRQGEGAAQALQVRLAQAEATDASRTRAGADAVGGLQAALAQGEAALQAAEGRARRAEAAAEAAEAEARRGRAEEAAVGLRARAEVEEVRRRCEGAEGAKAKAEAERERERVDAQEKVWCLQRFAKKLLSLLVAFFFSFSFEKEEKKSTSPTSCATPSPTQLAEAAAVCESLSNKLCATQDDVRSATLKVNAFMSLLQAPPEKKKKAEQK